jgi:hypothetical protein
LSAVDLAMHCCAAAAAAAAVRDYRRHNKYAARKVDRSPLDFSQVRLVAVTMLVVVSLVVVVSLGCGFIGFKGWVRTEELQQATAAAAAAVFAGAGVGWGGVGVGMRWVCGLLRCLHAACGLSLPQARLLLARRVRLLACKQSAEPADYKSAHCECATHLQPTPGMLSQLQVKLANAKCCRLVLSS